MTAARFVWLMMMMAVVGCSGEEQDLNDFRHISYQDLQLSVDAFRAEGITTYAQLLFDVARNQVLVGARDALFRLSLPHLRLLENATWPAPAEKTHMCLAKGQSEENCHNYIKVLLTNGKRVLACGTQSFSPSCTWREIESITTITERVDGIARCPYDPASNITALLTNDDDYYIGGPTDFSGSDFAIYKDARIRTKQYDSMWLNEPQFVGSFETDQFVYFVFREAAVEYINCGKIVYSRIARVCKKDAGGNLMLKDNWTTFIKARLNCSIAGQYPFYYNEVQDIAYVPEEGLLYATFTTSANSIAGSAVCAFNMSAIHDAFSGPFKYQEHVGATWNQHFSAHPERFECQSTATAARHDRNLIESSKYQLMDYAVQATSLRPLYDAPLERFTHITVDVLPLKSAGNAHVVYVSTQGGLVKKLAVLPTAKQSACLVEVWQTVPDSNVGILTMEYLKDTNSVYVGTGNELMRIPAARCDRHRSKRSCLNAMDPYCGWNELVDACTTAPGDPNDKYWSQKMTGCPVLNAPVDGGWSSWSDWRTCVHSQEEDSSDECACKTRACNNPATRNGGRECEGLSVAVTNCTRHGGWTSWSAWSECSATCGAAVKTRTRTCTNPAPAFGGRVCVGQDRAEVLCTGNPPCPMATPTPQDGGWGAWEGWSACSQVCGGGYRIRQRQCNNPPPLSGGLECSGTNIEYDECPRNPCSDQRRTAIVSFNVTDVDGEVLVKKVKISCRAPVAASGLIHLTHKEVTCRNRQCDDDGAGQQGVWGAWGEWSRCSASCGLGYETRERRCDGGGCKGSSVQKRECMVNCRGTWGCWSDWSPCSETCGWGIMKRYRSCLDRDCAGSNMEEKQCEGPPCGSVLGWEPWTTWSECDANQEQHRKRSCRAANPGPQICQGPSRETRMCISGKEWNGEEGESGMLAAAGVGPTIAYVVIALIFGYLAGIGTMYFHVWRRKQRSRRVPSSPHYMSTKLNPYISVPYNSRQQKRHQNGGASPSCTSTGTSLLNNANVINGTMRSLKFDTLKRNSHQNNCNMNTEVYDDKNYD